MKNNKRWNFAYDLNLIICSKNLSQVSLSGFQTILGFISWFSGWSALLDSNLSRNQTQNSTKDHTFSSPTIYLSKIILKSIQNLFLFRVMSIAISSSLSSVYYLTLSLTACGYYWKLQPYTWIWFGMINHPGKDYSGHACTNIM